MLKQHLLSTNYAVQLLIMHADKKLLSSTTIRTIAQLLLRWTPETKNAYKSEA